MLWNLLLSIVAGGTVWWVRGVNEQITDIRKLISLTREQMAKEYALKEDVERDLQKIILRFDRLESKIDHIVDIIHERTSKKI